MKLFVDTNVALGFCIKPDMHHRKSYLLFDNCSNLYWSSLVKKEFVKLYDKKIKLYYKFYQNLYKYLKNDYWSNRDFFLKKNYVNLFQI